MAKRGRKRTYENADELRAAVEAYFDECEAQGIFPDWAGLKVELGPTDDRTY